MLRLSRTFGLKVPVNGSDRVFDSERYLENNRRGIKYDIGHVETPDSSRILDTFDHSRHPESLHKAPIPQAARIPAPPSTPTPA